MIKKIGEKLEFIHYLFFFLNSIFYEKNSRKKSEIFFLFGFNFVTFYKKKSLFNSGPHRTDPCLIPVSGDHFKI